MLEVVDLTDETEKNLVNVLVSSKNKGVLNSFFETIISNVTDKNDYHNINLLTGILKRFSLRDIDLFWTESVRKNAIKITGYLNNLNSQRFKFGSEIQNPCFFISCLLSSTHRLLRDRATKALVALGENAISELFEVYKQMEDIFDVYIVERILAALCGVILRKGEDFKEDCIKIAEYLENKYFRDCKTTHILILDYVDTILQYVSVFYGYKKKHSYNLQQLTDWQMDEECRSEITGDGKATWGYGPIYMDFAKYTIGHHIASYEYARDKAPTLKETVAMIIWRMKQLGYDEKMFEKIDKECDQNRYNYSRHDNSGSIERYGKKYSWISFFELYGYFVLKGIVEAEVPNSFRLSSIDIDPTFPNLPKKVQLVTRCFLPRHNEDIQEWTNRPEKSCLKDIYVSNFGGKEKWVLLNSRHHQQNREKIRFDVNVDSFLLSSNQTQEVLSILNSSNSDGFDHQIRQYYYLFHGEIPWGKLIEKEDISRVFGGGKLVLYSPFAWFSWEPYHSRMNNIGNIPFLSQAICAEFGLLYNSESFSFHSKTNEMVTRYFNDSTSHYFFIRKDYICQFLQKYDLTLIWCESGYKYGDFGLEKKKKLDPSTSEFRSAEQLY